MVALSVGTIYLNLMRNRYRKSQYAFVYKALSRLGWGIIIIFDKVKCTRITKQIKLLSFMLRKLKADVNQTLLSVMKGILEYSCLKSPKYTTSLFSLSTWPQIKNVRCKRGMQLLRLSKGSACGTHAACDLHLGAFSMSFCSQRAELSLDNPLLWRERLSVMLWCLSEKGC